MKIIDEQLEDKQQIVSFCLFFINLFIITSPTSLIYYSKAFYLFYNSSGHFHIYYYKSICFMLFSDLNNLPLFGINIHHCAL